MYIGICSSWYEFDNPDKGSLSQKLLNSNPISPDYHLPVVVLYFERTEVVSVSACTTTQPLDYSMFRIKRNKFRVFVMPITCVQVPVLPYAHWSALTSLRAL